MPFLFGIGDSMIMNLNDAKGGYMSFNISVTHSSYTRQKKPIFDTLKYPIQAEADLHQNVIIYFACIIPTLAHSWVV